MKFSAICLFHGKGGKPEGSVLQLEQALRAIPNSLFKHIPIIRPLLAHTAESVTAEESFEHTSHQYGPYLKTGALVIGISLGGLIAAKLQEVSRPDLHIIAINAPTGVDNLRLDQYMENRVSLYNSRDIIIAGRTATWPLLTSMAYDLPWLTHNIDDHRYSLALLISTYVNGGDLGKEVKQLWGDENETK
jgi:hypothetical protein